MAGLAWQISMLVVLLLAMAAVYRLWQVHSDESSGRPRVSFFLLSVLVHIGLLFALDLVLITVPVIEAHREALEEIVSTALALGGGKATSEPAWERLPAGPPPPELRSDQEAPTSALPSSAFAPELRDVAPTISEALARTLPPERVLYVPNREAPLTTKVEALPIPRHTTRFDPVPPAAETLALEPLPPRPTSEEAAQRPADVAPGPEPALADTAPRRPELPASLLGPVPGEVALTPPKLERRRPKLEAEPPPREREPLPPVMNFALRKEEARKPTLTLMGGNAETEAAVGRGLDWLAAHQGDDGRWSLQFACRNHTCDSPGGNQSDPAATGLALMALLGAGQTPAHGSHGESLKRGLRWLVGQQKPDGDLSGGQGSRMYGHGLATIALCEAVGLTGEADLRDPARKALEFIVTAQDPASGGWRYDPRGGGDTSVLGWQLMALKSGEMAGLLVPAEAYTRAGRWLDAVSAGPDKHQYGYLPGHGPTAPMTAEALLARQYLGLPRDSAAMREGAEFLMTHLPLFEARNTYYWYYGTQVLFHLQGKAWTIWNGKLRPMLLASQVRDGPSAGSWSPRQPTQDAWSDQGGRLYETALSVLMLEVYYRHLPLYQQLQGVGEK
jgi:hypothetical protein